MVNYTVLIRTLTNLKCLNYTCMVYWQQKTLKEPRTISGRIKFSDSLTCSDFSKSRQTTKSWHVNKQNAEVSILNNLFLLVFPRKVAIIFLSSAEINWVKINLEIIARPSFRLEYCVGDRGIVDRPKEAGD